MKYSVVIPLYNKASYVGDTLSALLNQSRLPDELIVVDDASSDGSMAVVESTLAAHAARTAGMRLELLSLSRNGGPGNARNRGLALARGDYVQFLDADDILFPDCLERVIRTLREHPADFVILGYRRSGDGVARPTLAQLTPLLKPLGDGLYAVPRPLAAMANDGLGIVGSNLVCRRERVRMLRYDTGSRHFEGVDFWHRCFSSAPDARVLLLAEPLMEYRELPDSLLNRKAAHAREITAPALFTRLASTRDPEERALRRRLARVWLTNTLERLPQPRRRLALLWRHPRTLWRSLRWGWLPF